MQLRTGLQVYPPFVQEVSGVYTSPFLDTDELKMTSRAGNVSGLSRDGPQAPGPVQITPQKFENSVFTLKTPTLRHRHLETYQSAVSLHSCLRKNQDCSKSSVFKMLLPTKKNQSRRFRMPSVLKESQKSSVFETYHCGQLS